jgi:hypothetical protein
LIGSLLVLSFLIGYAQLAFFLRHETQSAAREQKAVFLEREIRSLKENFIEMRLWEKALFSKEHPEADKKFRKLMELMTKNLAFLSGYPTGPDIQRLLAAISKLVTQYETDFNRIVQLRTEQRLGQTLLDSDYQSLVSSVLRSNQISLLRPLFNLSHFQKNYLSNHRES